MDDVVKGITLLFEFKNILVIFGGVLIGVLVGALPGLSSPMAIALLMHYYQFGSSCSNFHDGSIILCRNLWRFDNSNFN